MDLVSCWFLHPEASKSAFLIVAIFSISLRRLTSTIPLQSLPILGPQRVGVAVYFGMKCQIVTSATFINKSVNYTAEDWLHFHHQNTKARGGQSQDTQAEGQPAGQAVDLL